jgi:hypothetical protein
MGINVAETRSWSYFLTIYTYVVLKDYLLVILQIALLPITQLKYELAVKLRKYQKCMCPQNCLYWLLDQIQSK